MKPGRVQAVLFDLDGTLLDTLPDLAAAVNTALRQMNLPIRDDEEIRGLIGGGMRELARRALPEKQTESEVDACLAALRRAYKDRCTADTVPYPGIPALVESLSASGFALGVVSNKPDEFTQPIIRHYFSDRFGFVTGALADLPRKPDPALALRAAQALRVDPAHCVFVGDSSVDVRTAFAAGMKPIGVSWGFRSREEILTVGNIVILDSARDLEKAILKLR